MFLNEERNKEKEKDKEKKEEVKEKKALGGIRICNNDV